MDTTLDLREDWQSLLKYLPAGYEALAHEYKMVETQYGNAKITTVDELWRVLFLHVGAELPLRDTAALLAITGSLPRTTRHRGSMLLEWQWNRLGTPLQCRCARATESGSITTL